MLGRPTVMCYAQGMRRAGRFLVVLVVGLAILAGVAYFVMTRTSRRWFEHDLTLRSQLAVTAARQSLTDNWSANSDRLRSTLTDLTRDERILSAAACSSAQEL